MAVQDIETVTAVDEFTAGWQQWHERHEQLRADGHGFLRGSATRSRRPGLVDVTGSGPLALSLVRR